MRKCCVCGRGVADGEGYESFGYVFHEGCMPKFPLEDKTRCYYCHKIMRRGDMVTALNDLGVGGRSDFACEKCVDKHFGRGFKDERKKKTTMRNMSKGTETYDSDSYLCGEDY